MKEDFVQKKILTSNELCSFTGIKPYVLRFWETEFPEIVYDNGSGIKLYPAATVEIIGKIKHLLFKDKLSIEQVKFELMKKEIVIEEYVELPGLPEEVIVEEVVLEEESSFSETLEQLGIAKSLMEDVVLATKSIQESYNWC